MSNCPRSLLILLEIPLGNFYQTQESIFITLVPAVINEFHLDYGRTGTSADVREILYVDFGSITYSYGGGDDLFGIQSADLTQGVCNLDVFCLLHPCVCGMQSLTKRHLAPVRYLPVAEKHDRGHSMVRPLVNDPMAQPKSSRGKQKYFERKKARAEERTPLIADWWKVLSCNGGVNPFAPNYNVSFT